MKEKCGIFGLYSHKSCQNNLSCLIQGLKHLQHRGQESCGIAYQLDDNLICKNGLGLVADVFEDCNVILNTNKCIGHVRYSTSGSSKIIQQDKYSECQPLHGKCKFGNFFLAHNGNIPNLKKHDTQYIIEFIENSKEKSWTDVFIQLIENIPAAYCLLIITEQEIFAIRDRYGIRPLCIGVHKNTNFCISSESCALQHYNFLREIKAGEIVRFGGDGLQTLYRSPSANPHICAFECIYFMNESSLCNGLLVSEIRKMLGIALAKKEKFVFDFTNTVVIGVPQTGIVSGIAYAAELNITYAQAITKNAGIGRTFIAPTDKERKAACEKKFKFDKSNINNKKVILIDDTIVRGNVMKTIIKYIYQCGAKEIHVRIPAPPIINKCTLGIDIPSQNELIAHNKNMNNIAQNLNASSINYLSSDDLDKILHFSTYKECFLSYGWF